MVAFAANCVQAAFQRDYTHGSYKTCKSHLHVAHWSCSATQAMQQLSHPLHCCRTHRQCQAHLAFILHKEPHQRFIISDESCGIVQQERKITMMVDPPQGARTLRRARGRNSASSCCPLAGFRSCQLGGRSDGGFLRFPMFTFLRTASDRNGQ